MHDDGCYTFTTIIMLSLHSVPDLYYSLLLIFTTPHAGNESLQTTISFNKNELQRKPSGSILDAYCDHSFQINVGRCSYNTYI